MLKFRMLALCAAAALPLFCVETKFWQQDGYADFEKGKLDKISVRSDGRMSLAPVVRELLDSSTPYLWAVEQDSRGNIYAGGGGPTASTAKLFRVDTSGKWTVVAELEGLEIHAIAIDRADRVYAATAPDGKIYRIEGGKAEVFYDPKAKYIWAMAFAKSGDLFVATGDRGEIHRVTPAGQGSVFFRTEETHARSLAIDAGGNLIVGTEPGGLVLRVTPAGEGFVLFQTPKREVTAVAVSGDGSIYAAAVGVKGASTSPAPVPAAPPAPAPPASAAGGTQIVVAAAKPVGAPPPPSTSPAALTGGSEVYRILPDGSQRKVWSHASDIAYAIAFDKQDRALVGTGNKGDIYRIDSELNYTLVVNVAPTQVTGFRTGRGGEIYAVTGNIGKLFQIGPEIEKQGTFESEAFDANAFTYWGRLSYAGDLNGGRVGFAVRSGNVSRPQKNWSSWAAVAVEGGGGRGAAPPARFLQYQMSINASADGKSPEVRAVEVAYMSKNLAPVVKEIEITPSNYKFPTSAIIITPSATPASLTLPAMGSRRSTPGPQLDLSSSQTMTYSKGGVGARWLAQDDNGDSLLFRVEIRGEAETQWKLLKDRVRDRFYGWDGTAFPDGKYVLRVTATDSASNPPDQALAGELVSDRFLIDNTPPVVSGLAGSVSGGKIQLSWKAKDALGIIEKAEYSVNGGDWIVAEPVSRLSDAAELDYRLAVDKPAGNEFTVAVRVTDEYDNQAVEKVVVR